MALAAGLAVAAAACHGERSRPAHVASAPALQPGQALAGLTIDGMT